MTYAVICLDHPDTRELRDRTRLAHIEHINAHRKLIQHGAALLEDAGEGRIGMVIAVDLPNREAVEEFMRNEPYNAAGIFESVMIRKCVWVSPEADPAHFDNLLIEERRKAVLQK